MKTILIYGGGDDPHLLRVLSEFERRGVKAILLDPFSDDGLNLRLSSTSGDCYATVRCVSGEKISLDKNTILWSRNKRSIPGDPSNAQEQVNRFQLTEKRMFWQSAAKLRGMTVVNDFNASWEHQCKPFQISLAHKVGLKVPPTCITNDVESFEGFRAGQELCLIKPLGNPNIPGKDEVHPFTAHAYQVKPDEIVNSSDIVAAPMILQKYIEKRYELRIFVFDDVWHAFKVDSQASKKGKIDWRLANSEDIFEPIKIDDELGKMLVKYLRKGGLHTGSFDFIANEAGEQIFLECNPEGQWGWLENEEAGYMPITNTIVDKLIQLAS